MLSKVRFQLEERMQPFAMAGKDGRAVAAYGEGGCLHLSPSCSVRRGCHRAHSFVPASSVATLLDGVSRSPGQCQSPLAAGASTVKQRVWTKLPASSNK